MNLIFSERGCCGDDGFILFYYIIKLYYQMLLLDIVRSIVSTIILHVIVDR